MKKICFIISVIIFISILVNCDAGNGLESQGSSGPILSSISPNSKASHMPTFILSVTGRNFVNVSKIVFNGSEKSTNFVSSTELTCEIRPDDTSITSVLLQNTAAFQDSDNDIKVPVIVRNPSADGGDSNTLDFTVMNNPEFENAKPISDELDSWRATAPDIALDSEGNINATWTDTNQEKVGVYFRRSTNGGDDWGKIFRFSHKKECCRIAKVAVDADGDIGIMWTEGGIEGYIDRNQIYFCRSTDNGSKWSRHKTVYSSGWSGSFDFRIDQNGKIVMVWFNQVYGKKKKIYFCHSNDNGSSWSTGEKICDIYPDIFLKPETNLTIDSSGGINVVWCSGPTYKREVYFSRSINNGHSWTNKKNLSRDGTDSNAPDVAVDSKNNVFTVWGDIYYDVYKSAVFFSRSTDNGKTWSKKEKLSETQYAGQPAISIDCVGNINVVWTDTWYNVYFRRSIDGGKSFLPVNEIFNGYGWGPAIEMDQEGNIYVVFNENRERISFIKSK